jgi:hypothetical protein
MYKIEIDWGFRSSFLQVATGIVRIENLDFGMISPLKNPGFPVKIESYSLGYRDCPAIFSRCKPLVDVMVRAYFDGLRMSDLSIEWFQDCHRKNNEVYLTMND